MGNICSSPCSGKRKAKDRPDSSNPALLQIREAQQKYFNSHIESDAEDSDEDFVDEDDSGDLYCSESEASLDNLDGVSVDSDLPNGRPGGLHGGLLSETSNTDRVPESIGDSGNGSATYVAAGDISLTSNTSNSSVNNNNFVANPNAISGTADASPNITLDGADAGSKPTTKTKKKGGGGKTGVKRRAKKRHISLRQRGDFFSIFNQEDKKARSVDPTNYDYPFENLVFEGGGNKGLAYCGAVRLLEELNIWPQIKRLAGTSAGAMTAALLAVGYDSHDLEQFFSLNLNNIFLDHRFGYLSLIPNLLSSFGWNPGKRIYKWFGHKLAERTGDPDITFKEVYDMYQRELCIVTTNLNQMTSLYCHPKTTPDMPVRLAVRMSMSIPGMFKAVRHTIHGQTDIFVDGGVLCNYPIHCFDGWWLSMKPEDNFLEKLQPLEDIPRLLERTERFGDYNEKTLGMQLYSDNEQDLLKYQLENLRHGVQLQELPNTKLAREKIRKKKLQLKTDREHRRLVKAMNAFLRALRKHNLDKNDNIDRNELEAALNDVELFPRIKRLVLFGDVDCDVILQYLDSDQNGQISYQELIRFMEETGISMQNRFLGYQRRNITNLPSFLDTLQATLLTNVKRVYVKECDLKRTVGINTGHVGTSDFVLEPADIEFVLERGKRSLEAFLKYYVATHRLKKKPEFRRTQVPRKGSKSSLLSSDSNSSLGNNEESVGLTGSLGNSSRMSHLPQHLSPIPSVGDATGDDQFDFSQDTVDQHNLSDQLINSERGKSRSSHAAKSVSISNHVTIMPNVDHVNVYLEEENSENLSEKLTENVIKDSVEDSHESEASPLLSQQDEKKIVEKSEAGERQSTTSAEIPQISKVTDTIAQIHACPDTQEQSPTTPLLEKSEASESFNNNA